MTLFLLVNGGTPSPQSFCALCCEPIGENYLREIATRPFYCDYQCYADHCGGANQALENYARASVGRTKVRSDSGKLASSALLPFWEARGL